MRMIEINNDRYKIIVMQSTKNTTTTTTIKCTCTLHVCIHEPYKCGWLVKVVTRARVRFQIRIFFITSLLRH